jgi:hypothetical protein
LKLRLRDRGFGDGDDGVERGGVEDRQLGERFAVELDVGLRAAVDELAIAQAAFAAGCVDADDPQFAELALACAAIAEGERFGANEVFFDGAEQPAATAGVALGLLEEPIFFALTRRPDGSTH